MCAPHFQQNRLAAPEVYCDNYERVRDLYVCAITIQLHAPIYEHDPGRGRSHGQSQKNWITLLRQWGTSGYLEGSDVKKRLKGNRMPSRLVILHTQQYAHGNNRSPSRSSEVSGDKATILTS